MKKLDVKDTMTTNKKIQQSTCDKYRNVAILLADRERGFTRGVSNLLLLKIAEEKAATSEMQTTHCQLPSSVRSTFLMSFSPDSSKVASTHGDHRIYVCDVKSGKLLHKLEGHPRTPWCLEFHPTSNDIIASGCLGGEVRVWDLHGGSEIWTAKHSTVITSLTFHPLDKVLVIATQNELHFWDWSQPEPFAICKTNCYKEKVRFVKFDSLGNKLITGISNMNTSNIQDSSGECSATASTLPRPRPTATAFTATSDAVSAAGIFPLRPPTTAVRPAPTIRLSTLSSRAPTIHLSTAASRTPTIQLSTSSSKTPTIQLSTSSSKTPTIQLSTSSSKTPTIQLSTSSSKTPTIQLSTSSSKTPTIQLSTSSSKTPTIQLSTSSSKPPTIAISVQVKSATTTQSAATGKTAPATHSIATVEVKASPSTSSQPTFSIKIPTTAISTAAANNTAATKPEQKSSVAAETPTANSQSTSMSPPTANPIPTNPAAVTNTVSTSEADSPTSSAPVVNSNIPINRKTLLNRIMNMYQQVEQLRAFREEVSSETPDASTTSESESNSNNPPTESGEDTENSSSSSESSDNLNNFRQTLQHLETLCGALERSLKIPQRPESSSERRVNIPVPHGSPTEFVSHSSSLQVPVESSSEAPLDLVVRSGETVSSPNVNTNPSSGAESRNKFATMGLFVDVLTRVRNLLQISSLTTSAISDQMLQIRLRLTEIVQHLSSVSGYRNNLTNLRRAAVEGMGLTLTRQLQKIFQAEYRLSQSQLHSAPPSLDTEANSSLGNPSRAPESEASGSSKNDNSSQHQNNRVHSIQLRHEDHSSMAYQLRARRETLNQLCNSRFQLIEVNREIQRFQDNLNFNGTYAGQPLAGRPGFATFHSNSCSNLHARAPQTRVPQPAHSTRPRVLVEFMRHERQSLLSHPAHVPLTPSVRNALRLINPRSLSAPVSRVPLSIRPIAHSHVRRNVFPEFQERSELRPNSDSFSSSRQSNFYIPEVHVENSSDSAAETEQPLPANERPRSPPLSAILQGVDALAGNMSSQYTAMVFEAGARLGMQEGTINFTHRIQLWDFSKYDLPDIGRENYNVVVERCKIHNDASVDISKDGELLVALVPSRPTAMEPLVFGVYSLRQENLGACLCTWGFESNAISVSLSPLGQYVVVGLSSPRPYMSSPEKEAVAQIFKLKSVGKYCTTVHVRSLTQLIDNENRYPQVSLNSVQWLPQPGHGLIYGTNRGSLCICKPTAPMTLKKSKMFYQNSLMQSSSISMGLNLGENNNHIEMSMISTQTTQPLTHSTGTQTIRSGRASRRDRSEQ